MKSNSALLLVVLLCVLILGTFQAVINNKPIEYTITPTIIQITEFGDLRQYEVEVRELEVTAYSPLDNVNGINADSMPQYTATMTPSRYGVVAVNPEVIPYGTLMYIPEYGWAVAEDTGAAMRRRTDLIDVLVMTYEEAIKWGRKRLPVVLFFKKG